MAGLGVWKSAMQRSTRRCSRASSRFWWISGPFGAVPARPLRPSWTAWPAYAGKLKVAKVNVDENGATPSRYGIRGIPALLFFKGGKVADQVVGFVPQDVIEEKIKRLLA
jgi:hypothetical protein